jgi:hypothetical protein
MKKLIVAAALGCVATSAAAELTYGTAFAKAHRLDVDGLGSADAESYGFGGEFRTGALTVSGELGNIDVEGLDLQFGSIGAGYSFGSGVTVGLDYTEFEILGIDDGVTSIYGTYSFDAYTLGAAIGETSEFDETVLNLFAAWDVTETGTVGLDIVHIDSDTLYAGYADYDADRYSVQADLVTVEDLDILALSGGYEVFDKVSVIGSFALADLGGLDVNAVTIGGQYEFTPGASLELALGRISPDMGDDIDLVTLGLSYEMGRRTSKRRTLGNIFSSATGSTFGLTDF